MKQVRIGDTPLEWFTGVGDLRSHDKACNNMTATELLKCEPVNKVSFDRAVVLAKRAEKKETKRLNKLGIDYNSPIMGRGVSVRDIITVSE